MLIVFWYVILVTFVPAVRCQLPRLPNLIYAVCGYDAIVGDPDAHVADPGVYTRLPIFDVAYTDNLTTSDGQFMQPDNIRIVAQKDCPYDSDTWRISDAISYQALLGSDASIPVRSSFPFQFFANPGFQYVTGRLTNENFDFVVTQSRCVYYTVNISPNSSISLTDHFKSAVRDLPLDKNGADDDSYLDFFDKYGTHFSMSTEMGTKIVARTQIDRSNLTVLVKCGFDVEVAAKLMLPTLVPDKASWNTLAQLKLQDFFNQKRTVTFLTFQGEPPIGEQSWTDWTESAKVNPMPIRYRLRPLTDLLTTSLIPELSPTELATKVTLMTESYLDYCLSYGLNCSSLTPSVNNTRITAVNSYCGSTNLAVKDERSYLLVVVTITLLTNLLANLFTTHNLRMHGVIIT